MDKCYKRFDKAKRKILKNKNNKKYKNNKHITKIKIQSEINKVNSIRKHLIKNKGTFIEQDSKEKIKTTTHNKNSLLNEINLLLNNDF